MPAAGEVFEHLAIYLAPEPRWRYEWLEEDDEITTRVEIRLLAAMTRREVRRVVERMPGRTPQWTLVRAEKRADGSDQ